MMIHHTSARARAQAGWGNDLRADAHGIGSVRRHSQRACSATRAERCSMPMPIRGAIWPQLARNSIGRCQRSNSACRRLVLRGKHLLAGMAACAALARAATYVVDGAAPGAADTNPGTEAAPFKTVQHAADTVQPGDVVCVMAGTYPERVTVKTSGAAGQPIRFRARPRRSAVVGGFDLHASYLGVEGFEITAAQPVVAVQLGGRHCAIVDNDIHDMMVGVNGTAGTLRPDGQTRDYSAVAHNRIAYNKVYHCQYGFILGGDDWLVENNEVNRLFMYTPGNKYDDCDYSRFFGRGCVERGNYFHGSTAAEIRVAHVDCLQTFTVNGEIAQDLLFADNACFDFHQLCMVESAPHLGSVRQWTLRGNIVSANAPTMSGGWGPDIIQTPDVTIAGNTIVGVRWAAIGLRGRESTNGLIQDNLLGHAERAVVDGDQDFSAARPRLERNLTFQTAPLPGPTNLNGQDPRFVDAAQRNFRLQPGSPAIHAGTAGVTIGALAFPNVYYVDPRHPAATDEPGWGYPAVPLATLTRACALAQAGDTIVLRGGVYRETLRPRHDSVTVRARPGETVILSGADVIEGWQRQPDGSWSAPLPTLPLLVLRDGQPWTAFGYTPTNRRIVVRGGDPRLHRYETVVRRRAIDVRATPNVKVEGITVRNLLLADAP